MESIEEGVQLDSEQAEDDENDDEEKEKARMAKKVRILRGITWFLNLLVLITSIGVCALGFRILIDEKVSQHVSLIEEHSFLIWTTGYLLIPAGFITFFVSSCAVCMSLTTKKNFLLYLLGVLSTMMIGLMTPMVMLHVYKITVIDDSEQVLLGKLRESYSPGDKYALLWDDYQEANSCCGVMNVKDYQNTKWYETRSVKGKRFVPDSCCEILKGRHNPTSINQYVAKNCMFGVADSKQDFVYPKGCHGLIHKWFSRNVDIAIPILLVVAALHVLTCMSLGVLYWQHVLYRRQFPIPDWKSALAGVNRFAMQMATQPEHQNREDADDEQDLHVPYYFTPKRRDDENCNVQ